MILIYLRCSECSGFALRRLQLSFKFLFTFFNAHYRQRLCMRELLVTWFFIILVNRLQELQGFPLFFSFFEFLLFSVHCFCFCYFMGSFPSGQLLWRLWFQFLSRYLVYCNFFFLHFPLFCWVFHYFVIILF